MKGKLAVLQTPMEMSKVIYAKVREKVSLEDGYEKLIAVPEKRDADIVQVSDDFNTVHVKQAPEAQKKLEFLIADEWEAVPKKERLRLLCQQAQRPRAAGQVFVQIWFPDCCANATAGVLALLLKT